MVQLNGEEGASFCAEVARRAGVKVIKAIHVSSAADVHGAEAYRSVDYHLFDRRAGGLPGGTGESFDWELLRGHRSEVPAILAGGLKPGERRRGGRDRPALRGRRRQRRRGRAGPQGPRQDGGLLRGRQLGRRRRPDGGDRGAVRPLRGPLRARDPDRGARRADRGLGRGARRSRLQPAPGRPAARLHRPADAALPGRAPLRAGRLAGLPEARGPRPHRRPQDQQRARPDPARRADGQAADHRRDRGGPARRRHRDRLRAARPRMHRLHGHRGHPPPGAERRADAAAGRRGGAGRGGRADAEGGRLGGDPRLGRQRRDDPLRDRLGGRAGAVSVAGAGPAAGDRRRGAGAVARGRGRAAATG